MMESLGAACHHLGQPATVVLAYLELIRTMVTDPTIGEMLDECLKSAQAMGDLLKRLNGVSEYRTTEYVPVSKEAEETSRILAI